MTTSFSAITTVQGQAMADTLSNSLEALQPEPMGVGIFEVEDGSGLWEVAAYFTGAPDIAGISVLEAVHNISPFQISEIPDQDWVAKVRRDLPPVEAGRFFIYGSHASDLVPTGSVPLLIEAAMAFGTGHHGTTLGCLRALDRLVAEGFTAKGVIDVGCGTAVLAMAAAHVFDQTIWASDIDPTAVDVAKANVAANGLEGRVNCVIAAGFDAPELNTAGPFDLVFANILKGPLIALAEDMESATTDEGILILSGILNEQADEVVEVYARSGFNLLQRDSIVDWTTLTLGKSN